ncbi:tyrosine-type recombinase/integrase [Ruegeria atlantica]|uniref:tyrosine-type recombinase/integrase n=1 Tax=Ruegeria atlantica TaxID=81569 RepID=UPI002494DE1B|nr:site-specific integrase [Ruegeria atlantica]
MVAKKLSSRDVKTLDVGDYADGDGLWLRVLPSGRRSWTFQYAQGQRRRKMAIGQYPALSLSEARMEALRLRALVAQGKDPKAPLDAAPDVATAVAEYLEKEVSQLSANSQKSYRSFLSNHLVERYGHLNLSQFTDRHLAALMDSIVTSGRPATASAVFRVVRRFLNWAMRTRRYIDTNPADLVAEPKPPKSRDRVLTAAEIASIQGALGQEEGSVLVRLLFLTAARLNEVAHMRWEDLNLDEGLWTIPDTKNGTVHIVPLSDPALTILKAMHTVGSSGYVISGSLGLKPYSGFSKLKRRIDEASGVTDWRFHDIRRTAATIMRRAGIDRDVVKAVLNHKVSDVTAVYDRYDQLEERRIALRVLAKELSQTNPLSSAQIIKRSEVS